MLSKRLLDQSIYARESSFRAALGALEWLVFLSDFGLDSLRLEIVCRSARVTRLDSTRTMCSTAFRP